MDSGYNHASSKFENSVLIDLTTKSTKKLTVQPPANLPVTDCDKYI